jgi:hypothetical protein
MIEGAMMMCKVAMTSCKDLDMVVVASLKITYLHHMLSLHLV